MYIQAVQSCVCVDNVKLLTVKILAGSALSRWHEELHDSYIAMHLDPLMKSAANNYHMWIMQLYAMETKHTSAG